METSILLPSAIEYRPPPANLLAGDEYLFEHEYRKTIPECRQLCFHDVAISSGSFYQEKSGYIDSLFPASTPRSLVSRVLDAPWLLLPKQPIHKAAYASVPFGLGYFHWFADYLQIIQLWIDCREEGEILLLPACAADHEFVERSLSCYGLNPIYLTRGLPVIVDRLRVIGSVADSGNYRTHLFLDAIKLIRSRIYSEVVAISKRPSLIYISRKDAKRRHLANDKSVCTLVESMGGQVLLLEGAPLDQQVILFSRCSILLGIHGAGLTNMMWMPEGSFVLEIRRKGDSHNNCFFSMAASLGHRYFYLEAEMLSGHSTYDASLSVSMDKLQSVLSYVLSQ
jgi:capsular polysaccharide biosynthesis protein